MEKLKTLFLKYYEQIAYLFFGGVATLLNFVLLNVFQAVGGLAFAAGAGNVLNNAICILFAYWTNRTFVFKSKNHGAEALREFGKFVGCRIFTAVVDQLLYVQNCRSALERCIAGRDARLRYRWRDGRVTVTRFRKVRQGCVQAYGLQPPL